jgi:hypothetical protein
MAFLLHFMRQRWPLAFLRLGADVINRPFWMHIAAEFYTKVAAQEALTIKQ